MNRPRYAVIKASFSKTYSTTNITVKITVSQAGKCTIGRMSCKKGDALKIFNSVDTYMKSFPNHYFPAILLFKKETQMIKSAEEYHDKTSYTRDKLGGHQLDWQNQPALYKKYDGLKSIPLPEDPILSSIPIKSILKTKPKASCSIGIDIKTLSIMLRLAYCITASANYSGGTYYYRSAASAGALYPAEIYIMTRDMDGLDDGIYHYNLIDHSLTELRLGDFSVYIGKATFPRLKNRPVVSFILSSIFFRSSWKYRDRAYRYHLLDTGHVLENLILALNSLSMPFNIFYDFDDTIINKLIGVDEFREAALSIINIAGMENQNKDIQPVVSDLPDNILDASITSGMDIDYPPIREIHEAGKIPPHREAFNNSPSESSLSTQAWITIEDSNNSENNILYPECLFRRRSRRNFINKSIDRNDFMAILDIISGESELNHESFYDHELLNIAFFAEKIDNIPPGLYALDRTQKRFGLIQEGIFGEKIAHTCLNQEWLKNAGLHFLFTCNIDELDRKYSPRGYRYAMMNAGRIGQLLYITATSFGLGCCGIGAFYDDETMNLLGLGNGERMLYLVGIGKTKS